MRYCPSPVKRRVVDGEKHRERRLVDLDPRQRDRLIGIGDGVADVDGALADDGDDVAGLGDLDLGSSQLVKDHHAVDRARHVHVALLDEHGLLPALDSPRIDPADRDPADILREVERGAEHAKRAVGIDDGARYLVDDQVEKRLDISRSGVQVVRGEPGLAGGEDVGEIELIFTGPLLDERVEDLVQDFIGPRIGPVDLVDHDDRPDVAGKRLAQHELGLRHRALEGVDQDECTVGHLQGPLDLASEVGVAGRVDDVDLGRAVVDGDVLGQDGDAALALQVVGVEDPLSLELGGAELPRLAKHRVDQGGLAVVNVGNDGHVSDIISSLHGFLVRPIWRRACFRVADRGCVAVEC